MCVATYYVYEELKKPDQLIKGFLKYTITNSTPCNLPIENGVGLIARYIKLARGKVK